MPVTGGMKLIDDSPRFAMPAQLYAPIYPTDCLPKGDWPGRFRALEAEAVSWPSSQVPHSTGTPYHHRILNAGWNKTMAKVLLQHYTVPWYAGTIRRKLYSHGLLSRGQKKPLSPGRVFYHPFFFLAEGNALCDQILHAGGNGASLRF